MKVLGKVGNIEPIFSKEKVAQDGTVYYSEKYYIFIESGDDTIMAESNFIESFATQIIPHIAHKGAVRK